ncbi:MAG: hypothetical protein COA67_08100 [Lutibacter sp.]|nr:MAG: hypothetical protein COA67_08100 [Lutibacter sp.]
MFQHYIITRFNLRRDDWNTTKNNEVVLSDSWLEERFELFENYCFPSVKNQTNQHFKWLVFFDVNTPEIYKSKIEDFVKEYDNFHPFFIDGMKSFIPSIIEKVDVLDTEKYIITSRLDNDDCIHQDYTSVVQSFFDKQDYMAIDVTGGYGMEVGNKIKLGKMLHLYNPYISLIERKERVKTVWHKGHTHWKYERNILEVKNKHLWLTIIHEKNKSNKFRGFGKVKRTILDEFNISSSISKSLIDRMVDYKLWYFDSFKNKFYLLSAYYGKKIKKQIGFYRLKSLFAKNRFD